nr:MAG TPA: hypothetical protein [Caudoviricetes sp.]
MYISSLCCSKKALRASQQFKGIPYIDFSK